MTGLATRRRRARSRLPAQRVFTRARDESERFPNLNAATHRSRPHPTRQREITKAERERERESRKHETDASITVTSPRVVTPTMARTMKRVILRDIAHHLSISCECAEREPTLDSLSLSLSRRSLE